MTHHRRLWPRLAVACFVLAIVSAITFEATYNPATVTELQPEQVQLGGDLVIYVGAHWTKEGFCDGQFTVTATETATQVRVDNVISREYRNESCAGVGTPPNQTVWAELRLAARLGDREVVRTSDGARLPVTTFPN